MIKNRDYLLRVSPLKFIYTPVGAKIGKQNSNKKGNPLLQARNTGIIKQTEIVKK